VAIKISQFQVKASMVKRFENERQILAKLNHPHIAQLLDGSAAQDGRPYLVMEYVSGKDIATFCIEKKLGLRARLGLVLQICEAVSYAHQQLVLHRDLKPNNILVNEQNQVKLLDFGIGKLLDEEQNHAQTATQIMTRSYASPEQIKGEHVSTASDLFSLAVVTYELLTGYHPYPCQSGLERDQNVVSGKIRKFTNDSDKTKAIYPNLSTIADERLRGDIETILHKALAPSPKERYASVETFAEDIKNYLHNKAIMARKPTPWYVFKKMVQRHKAIFSVVTLSMVLLMVLTAVALVQANKAKFQAQIAKQEAEKANMTTHFLTELLTKAKPLNNAEMLTVNDLLLVAYDDLQQDTSLVPELKFQLIDVVYQSMMNLSMFEETEATIKDDYQSCVLELSETDASCQNLLIGQFLIHNNSNQSELAVPILQKAEAISLAKTPVNKKELLYIYDGFVIVYTDLEQPKKSINYAEKALIIRKNDPNYSPDDIRIGHNNLALSLILDGQMNRALEIMQAIPEYLAQITDPSLQVSGREKLHGLWAFYHSQNKNSILAAEERLKAQQVLITHFGQLSNSMLWTQRIAAKNLMLAGRFGEAKNLIFETLDYMATHDGSHQYAKQRMFINLAVMGLIDGDDEAINENLQALSEVDLSIKPKGTIDDWQYWVSTWQAIKYQTPDWEPAWKGLEHQLLDDEGQLSELSKVYISLTDAWVAIQHGKFAEAKMAIKDADQYWLKYPNHYLHLKLLSDRLKNI
jgi:tRNA A-37 threonylcarbamoyl transferase component Bud32/transcription antitermination factor NusG